MGGSGIGGHIFRGRHSLIPGVEVVSCRNRPVEEGIARLKELTEVSCLMN